ncbi:MAG: precorrin-3B synthase [Sporichthyaceae bacterium]
MSAPSAEVRRLGPDACPGVHTVWSAVDGGLARVRLPGGRLSGEQLGVLATAAGELGSGVLELTARANIQVRGLVPAGERALARRLREADLLPSESHDRVRNIMASPLTGLALVDRPSRTDVSSLVAQLDERLCDEAVLAGLPGRFLFAVDDGSRDVLDPPSDVALLAIDPTCETVSAINDVVLGGGRGYLMVLGGAGWGLPVSAASAAAAALAAARAFLAERGRHCSPAWRLSELEQGPERVATAVRAELADVGEPVPAAARRGRPAEPGVYRQDDGQVALVVGTADGTLTAHRAQALAAQASPLHGLRVTPWRSLVLPGLDPPQNGAPA